MFTVFPPDLRKWARDNGWKSPPTDVSPLCGASESGTSVQASDHFLTITSPHPGASILLDPLIPDDHELLTLEARADDAVRTVDWYVNDRKVGTGNAPDFTFRWKPGIGTLSIEARAGEWRDEVRVEVRR